MSSNAITSPPVASPPLTPPEGYRDRVRDKAPLTTADVEWRAHERTSLPGPAEINANENRLRNLADIDILTAANARLTATINRGRTARGQPLLDEALGTAEPLPFYTPADIAKAVPDDDAHWLIHGFIAKGNITEVDGKIKAAGKTALSLDAVRCIIRGESFLGRFKVKPGKVVFLTEQSKSSLKHALARANLLLDEKNLHISFIKDMRDLGLTWPQIVAQAIAKCREVGADLLVADTLAKLAGVKSENDGDGWGDALDPLMNARDEDLAVLFMRHDRKGGGEVGDSGRGHSSASGDVDIIFDLKRPEGNHSAHPNRRVLESLGRWADITPEKIVIEMTDEGFIYVGDEDAVSLTDARRYVTTQVRAATEAGNKGLTLTELCAADNAPSRASIQRAIKALITDQQLTKGGKGVKGSPEIYCITLTTPEHPRALKGLTPA